MATSVSSFKQNSTAQDEYKKHGNNREAPFTQMADAVTSPISCFVSIDQILDQVKIDGELNSCKSSKYPTKFHSMMVSSEASKQTSNKENMIGEGIVAADKKLSIFCLEEGAAEVKTCKDQSTVYNRDTISSTKK